MERLIRYRHNVMHVRSIESFVNIRGRMHTEYKDVYFVRMLGYHPGLIDEICEMDSRLTAQMQANRLYYKRIHQLPRLSGQQDAAYYCGCYDRWSAKKQEGIQTKADVNAQPSGLARQLGAACDAVIRQYSQNGMVTESMKKNFAVKLLYWFDFVFSGMESQWDVEKNIKIAADNVVKEQEYLFYYMLTLVGCDVLLLQSREDVAAGESLKRLSEEITTGGFWAGEIPGIPDVRIRATAYGKEKENQIQIQIPKRDRPRKNQAAALHDQQEIAEQIYRSRNQGSRTLHKREKSFEELAMLASSIVQIAVHDREGEVVATGSGIMVGKAGYILTNHHVAAGGYSYSVRIEDDETAYHTDELIKYHPVLDLAILRISRKLVPLVVYQGPEKLARGQAVAAIGSPLGMFNSISNGIISGFRRVNGVDMIQFTAPISHGSSGGALLNMQGEVIGISTAGFDEGQNLNLAVGYESINLFIRGFV